MEFILSHLDSNSSNVDKELLEEIPIDGRNVVQMAITCVNTWKYFTSAKLDEESRQSINPNVGVRNILVTMRATPSLFKFFTNFTLGEFEKLAPLAIPIVISHVRSTREPHLIIV
jgi:hypothetical protein